MINRRKFLQTTACSTGLGILTTAIPQSILAMEESIAGLNNQDKKLILKNVRIETGFVQDDIEVTKTETDLFTLTLQNGKITAIQPNSDVPGAIDAHGYLLMPAMKDMHIHLDKTYYGGPWKARSKRQRSLKDMIELEKQILPEMLKTSTERAGKLIELLQSNGTNFARSHVNIEPTSKLKSLENLQKALENKKGTFEAELIAFPQHGLFCSGSESLMKEAAQMDIDFIGGLDPFAMEGNIEKTIDFTVQLALDYKKGIDIHLHEGGESGLKTVQYLIQKVNENPILKGKTTLSHCFVLREPDKDRLEDIVSQLADAQISITTTVPTNLMPIPALQKQGVLVMSGTDSVMDHWSSSGSGSMLQKAGVVAQHYGSTDDLELSRCIGIATQGLLSLDNKGNRQWPRVGDEASFNLVDASCSAETVARQSTIKALYHKGKCAYKNPLYDMIKG